MKRRILTSLKCLLSGMLFLSSFTTAMASYTATVTSANTTYTPGASNTFNFSVGVTTDGSFEYVDNISFTFPAGWTITAITPATGFSGCGSGAGASGFTATVASWTTPGHPSGCGAYASGNYAFTVTATAPAAGGPLTVNAQTRGDGWPSPLSDAQVSNFALNFAPLVPCEIHCPATMNFNLDPGACSQVVDYNVFSTGVCEVVDTIRHFTSVFAPDSIDYWEQSPNPGNFGSGVPAGPQNEIVFNAANTTLTIKSGVTPPAQTWCYTGLEWDLGNSAAAVIDFDYTYTNAPNWGSWDQFVIGIGSPGDGMGDNQNNFCNNFTGYWTPITAQFGPSPVTGHITQIVPANGTLSLAMATSINFQDGTPPGQVVISNFQSVQAVPALVQQTSGLPSGSEFPIGTTTNCFKIDLAPAGSPVGDLTCCFDVVVHEFPNPIAQLNCNNLINISLDEDCSSCIGADDVLEGGPYHCYDDYIVELDKTLPYGNGPWVPGCLNASDIGKTYQVRVTDPETGNKCWGNVKVEDKLAPVLDCPLVLLPCNFPSYAPEFTETATLSLKFAASDSDLPKHLNAGSGDFTFNIPIGIDAIVNDVDLRVKIDEGVWWNADIEVISPSGTVSHCFEPLGACGNGVPFFTRLDDEGALDNTCANIEADLNMDYMEFFGFDALDVFDGENVEGTWQVHIQNPDAFGFGFDTDVQIVELYINMTGDFTAGFPNGLQYGVDVFGSNGSYVVNAGAGDPIMESCSNVTLTYIDTPVSEDCASGLTGHLNRKWTAKDASGNTSTCVQQIDLLRPTLADVVLPVDYDGIDAPFFTCADGGAYPTPQWIENQGLQGYPWLFNQPTGCSINFDYDDLVIEVCDGTYKIRREWTIIDWCIGDGFTYNQIIKVVDENGPSMVCPANMTVSIDPYSCCAQVNLPDVIIEDNCSQINNVSGMVVTFDPFTGEQTGMHTFGGSVNDFPGNNYWDLDTLGAFGVTPCLPQGTHTVTYIAEDDCGNTSTCSFRLTVRDYVAPVASCDETTTIAIGVDDPYDCYGPEGYNGTPPAITGCEFAGVTWVKATVFNDGSYDQCNTPKFTVRRMAPYSDCILGLNAINGFLPCDDPFPDFPSEFERATAEYDSIKFYCCEVGTIQTVILRVYQVDVNGNIIIGPDGTPVYNECMIQVEVQDKLRPVCVPPSNFTVTCEQFDPSLWLYGKANVYDNCCLDETKVYQDQCGLTHSVSYSQFDTLCNKGTITRTFRAFDCHGNSSQCTQRIVVTYEQDYYVRFPNDVIVTVCDGTGNYGEPTFFGEDCELLGVSFEDDIFTVVPDACYKIERNWKIINWCTYDPNKVPLCIDVPNPNPNAITNHPTNLPGPIVSPVQLVNDPWKSSIVKIKPTDPNPGTNYSIYYDPNANCYTYKQIIKVIDTKDPIADCPPSPQTICDLTANDPLLWNASYWWDNGNQSHDLCEAPSDICLTATDDCSGANINFEYQLFLDLDGNGTMETVVNSTNLGSQPGGLGWNNILYNNVAGPAQARHFDDRLVPSNQKWGFALQETVTGNSKTACVKFNTFQAQNTFVTPQLPHGTHKIKWFVTDGCGNETICEYTIIIRDCKAPTVVCHNPNVNIMPTGMIVMWDTDFIEYVDDNCTLTPYIKTGIRKCGDGTGFPVDQFGQPIKSVTFTCSEVGEQCVELWAIDLAGNADYCEATLTVQDNGDFCTPGGGVISVSGALKTETEEGVEGAFVEVSGTPMNVAGVYPTPGTTDDNGAFVVNSVPVSSALTITPTKDDNPLNGVTTYDLLLISKHILGITPLSTPYQMIAADANKSNSITSFDIVEIRKLILGINQEFPANTSWRFVDKAQVFSNPANPFQDQIRENISAVDAMANLTNENFVGVKIGDVNNTVVPNSLVVSDDRSVGTLLFDVNDRDVKAGEEFEVAFAAAERTQGFQMTLNLNGLEVSEIVGNDKVNSSNFGVHANALTVSVDGAESFTVKFRAAKAGKLSEMMNVSSSITKAEGYSMTNGRMEVALRFDGKTISGVGFELYQNQPNPFVNKTFVGFNLPEAATATLTVYDETGRAVFTQKGDFAKGYNAISLDRALLNTTGVLYYTLETATDSATKKMIQAK